MTKRSFLMVLVVGVLTASLALAAGQDEANGEGGIRLGASMSTLANPYFVTMAESGEAIADDLGVQLQVVDARDDINKQVSDIQDLIAQQVDGLIINPVDSDAIGSVVREANNAGIPVITVTRPSMAGNVLQHIDSDNVQGGKMIAEEVARQLDGEGQVIELQGIPGAPSTRDRGEGFRQGLAEYPDIEIVASQTAHYNRQEALEVTENLLEAHPDVDAIFGHNDEMALGAIRALKGGNINDDVLVFGFDAVDDALQAIEQGDMAATVAQQPDLQMELAVENMVKYLNGEELQEDTILAPLRLVTRGK